MASPERRDATVEAPPAPAQDSPGGGEQRGEHSSSSSSSTSDSAPLPTPHTPTAPPALPGPRATRLRDTYAHALRRTLARLAAWDNFAGCFPTLAARADGVLRQVQGQMVEKLAEKCQAEFDNILAARHVVARLNDLEALVADATARRLAAPDTHPTPPHLLPPERVLDAHLAAALAPHRSLLNARLQTIQAQNALLADHVRRQRADIDALLARLDAAVDDVRGANRALGPVAAELADEARTAAVDMP